MCFYDSLHGNGDDVMSNEGAGEPAEEEGFLAGLLGSCGR